MSHPDDQLAQNYTAAFVGYLSQRGEATLRAAYELGRAALADGISLLDLVRCHHAVFGRLLSATSSVQDQQDILSAAAEFLVEVLASYEMARRGFLETSTAAAVKWGAGAGQTPFPAPPSQTGHEVLPHPAFPRAVDRPHSPAPPGVGDRLQRSARLLDPKILVVAVAHPASVLRQRFVLIVVRVIRGSRRRSWSR